MTQLGDILSATNRIPTIGRVAVVVLLVDARLLCQQRRTLGRSTCIGDVSVLVGAAVIAAPLADAPLMAWLLAVQAFALGPSSTATAAGVVVVVGVGVVEASTLTVLLVLQFVVSHAMARHFGCATR